MTALASANDRALLADVELLVGDGDPIVRAARVHGGYGHRCWLVVSEAGRKLLVKVPLRHAQRAEIEAQVRAQRLALAAGVPAPTIVATALDPRPDVPAYFVQHWVDGDMAEDRVQADGYGWVEELGRLTAVMHDVTGETFTTDMMGSNASGSWRLLAGSEVDRNLRRVADADLAPRSVLERVGRIGDDLVAQLPDIVPSFVHSDLWLRNVILRDGRLVALLDYEQVAYRDPAWDFVKLDAWVFRRWTRLTRPFLDGYFGRRPHHDSFRDRLAVCRLIEHLSATYYFSVQYPDPDMAAESRALLVEWAGTSGEVSWLGEVLSCTSR